MPVEIGESDPKIGERPENHPVGPAVRRLAIVLPYYPEAGAVPA